MIKLVDRLAEFTGKLAAWMFFAVGLMVTYEVFMRYVFTHPTSWVDEISRICQIWAAYLAGAFVLKHRDLIVIEVAFHDRNSLSRKLVESFALIVIAFFCVVAVYYGAELWWKSTLKGHTTDSNLGVPKWLTQASIWVGFGLLLLQTAVEMIKIWTIGLPEIDPEADTMGGAH